MINGIDECIATWCQKKDVESVVMQYWKNTIKQLTDDQIITLNNRLDNYKIIKVYL